MQKLNKEFAGLHSISTLLNIASIGGLGFHALVRSSFVDLVLVWVQVSSFFAIAYRLSELIRSKQSPMM
jgi:hypothetical protein